MSTKGIDEMKLIDLTGQKFGRLTVIERAENSKQRRAQWFCKCDCGNSIVVRSAELLRGNTHSCGCFKKQRISETHTTHGMKGTKIYRIWCGMIQRCTNPNNPKYKDYGERGIKVCERWLNFENFYEDISKLLHFGEKCYSLDRINNNGNYEPSNLRWATSKMQCRNKSNNRLVEYEGNLITLTEASELSGINYGTLRSRYKQGDRGDKLFRPVR